MAEERLDILIGGARGSASTGGPRRSRVGGETASVLVESGAVCPPIILDMGSGTHRLLVRLKALAPARLIILLSHLHLDHIVGLPLLLNAVGSRCEILVLCGQGAPASIVGAGLERIFSAPFFPVSLARMAPRFSVENVHEVRLPGVTIEDIALNHPGGASGFRINAGSNAFVYASDFEIAQRDAHQLSHWMAGATLALCDTTWTEAEGPSHSGWGHSDVISVATLAKASRVRHLGLFHHAPLRTDEELDEMLATARRCHPGSFIAAAGQQFILSDGALLQSGQSRFTTPG